MDKVPQYWGLLSEQDKMQYKALRFTFIPDANLLMSHNLQSPSFEDSITKIRNFAERGDENDWIRFLVCGICWLDNAIAINTRQLRVLISKCKSTINSTMQKLGYVTATSHNESWKTLFPKIPYLESHYNELRQWTVRYKIASLNRKDVSVNTQNHDVCKKVKGVIPFPIINWPTNTDSTDKSDDQENSKNSIVFKDNSPKPKLIPLPKIRIHSIVDSCCSTKVVKPI